MNSKSAAASPNITVVFFWSPCWGRWCPCLEDDAMACQQHPPNFSCPKFKEFFILDGACGASFHHWWGNEHARGWTLPQSELSVGQGPAETGGTTRAFWPPRSHKSFSQQRGVGWKKMSPWSQSCTQQSLLLCLVGARSVHNRTRHIA